MDYRDQIEQAIENHFPANYDVSHWEFYCFRDITVATAIHGMSGEWFNIDYKIISGYTCIFHGDEFSSRYTELDAVLDLLEYIESSWYRSYFLEDLSDYQLIWLEGEQADQLFNDVAFIRDCLDLGLYNLDTEDHNEEIRRMFNKYQKGALR